jgi:hypothetical protein
MASYAYNLEEFVRILESWGLTDVLLPFLLIYVVIFAVLTKTKILGEGRRRFNAVISLVIALMVVVPHVLRIYPPEADVIEIMNKAIPNISLVVVAIVMLLVVVGILGGERNWMGGSLSGWVAILAFILVIVIFGSAAGWWRGWTWFTNFFGADAVAIVVMILVFAVIVWWITKGEATEEKEGALARMGKSFQDFFKPGK